MENKITLLSSVIFIVLLLTIVSAVVYIYSSKTDFDQGTYNNTYYNETNNAVQLNLSYNNGTYTSQIFNTSSNVSLNNLSWTYQRIQCPQNMAYINKLNGYCIDQYEASPLNADESYNTSQFIYNSSTFTTNLLNAGGKAGSASNRTPWVYISANSARTACNNSGKHLCTSEEWLGASNINGSFYNLPTNLHDAPYKCVTDSATYCATGNSPGNGNACNTGMNKTGGISGCVSAEGVYDMTGNVWEWTNETVGYTKPCQPVGTSGYCYWDGTTFTNSSVQPKYGNDGFYFLDNSTARTGYAVRRGGSWLNGADTGPFCGALHSGPTDLSSSKK
ncbi:MAG: SUMF1/EgtB/PvdO family nonheme iron enzyme [Candidatus Pacearchaeota archaeon]|nr:SUMF1/EgtB/PvdO family nonheme iron enzyme [Candidatus Pacearchaeota archaeon]